MKLVVHIGHGKTGSTSIQQSLLNANGNLETQGVKYLGMMLEHARTPEKRSWQVPSGSDLLFKKIPPDVANADILAVLEQELALLHDEGVSRAIWSNEWLLTRRRSVLPALTALRDQGFDIEIQCYVRRHDKWAQSAYSQWGIKHKSYEGPLRDFKSWLPVFGDKDFRFTPDLLIWDRVFGEGFKVFNFDAAGDVVQHFLHINGVFGVSSFQENITPDPSIVAAQAVFNSRKRQHVFPTAFDGMLRRIERSDENRSILPTLDKLNPSAETLQNLVADRQDDILQINHFLERTGEPLLSFASPPKQSLHPTPWEMDQVILKLLYVLVEEVEQLRAMIRKLQAEAENTAAARRTE